jgi:lipoprotein NlpI
MNKEYKKNLEMTENKLISKYYEENEIPYHYIWYYIDEKSKKKVPIGEYNKALKKTVEQKLKKQMIG